jgi:hypothetical protein
MKEMKLGLARGVVARLKMYREIVLFRCAYVVSGRARQARRIAGNLDLSGLGSNEVEEAIEMSAEPTPVSNGS